MSDIRESLKNILESLDKETKPLGDHEIARLIQTSIPIEPGSDPPMEFTAEVIAFSFCEDYSNQETGWGTYYGPMFVFGNGDGTATESPSLTRVTEPLIKYWIDRANTAKNPVLRRRYADLVWDFQRKTTGVNPHFSMAQIVIDNTIEIALRNCGSPEASVKTKLERALALACSINDDARIHKVADAIIAYEDTIRDDSKLGLWGFSYDLLFDNEKVKLTSEQRQKLIGDLEDHLLRASNQSQPQGIEPWAAQDAAYRLAKYYRKIQKPEEMKRVLTTMGNDFIKLTDKISAMQASAWLQTVHRMYSEFCLKNEAEEIAVKLRNLGSRVNSELKSIEQTIEIPQDKIDSYIEAITEGDSDKIFARIAQQFIPLKTAAEKQLKDIAKDNPIQFLIPTQLLDISGRPVAKIGSLEEDLAGHVVKYLSQGLHIESILLRKVFEKLASKYTNLEEVILNYLYLSPVFIEERKPILQVGLKAYVAKDYLTASHLLIPQIENTFRVLVEKTGESIFKPTQNGGFNFKILDELLREPNLASIFGEDEVFYFRVLLVDPRGWNLRNCVSHGFCRNEDFGPSIGDRLVHTLICLAQIREKKSNTEPV